MMTFIADSQTVNDLQIFSSEKGNGYLSIHKLFGVTNTHGGKNRLWEMLDSPVADLQTINERKAAVQFFQTSKMPDVDGNMLDFIEYYLQQGNYPTRRISKLAIFRAWEKIQFNKLNPTNEFYVIERGIIYTIEMMNAIHDFALQIKDIPNLPALLQNYSQQVCNFLAQPEYAKITKEVRMEKQKKSKGLSASRKLYFDYMFRYTHKEQVRFFLDFAYECDVFQSVARSAAHHHFVYPEVVPATDKILKINGLFHPFIKQPVANDIYLTESNHLAFITGPNMAGKSTFLKSLGVAVYLAHVGFPVPAASMKISLLSGISTTINIPDDLNLGYSHFYSEVQRLKKVAEDIHTHENMLVIFDELFRGTNVKDAQEGSIAVISALSKVSSCFFAISTHIVEVAEDLVSESSVRFYSFDAEIKNDVPAYTYKMKDGITDTRLGMYIIRKEKLIEKINQSAAK
ncbi:MAG: hypothetical protein LBV39_05290 [Bacteroidales bacterium]|jgi:DNA mismatch repair ATPase MutS|nr:hypothetical protein [Bacteroidales bacterium]